MIKNLFPIDILNLLSNNFNFNGIYEVRVRINKPIYINYFGEYVSLKSKSGERIFAEKKLVDFILSRATEMSVYRYNSQIKEGFITTSGGIRIGLAGEVVDAEGLDVRTIKNPTSLVIRVPHEVKNCANQVLPYIVDSGGIKNTLIISPPGCGKTTFIRDIARALSYEKEIINSLIVDERFEISGFSTLDVGATTDVILGGNKEFAFTSAVRALRPDVIITDEIGTKSDAYAIKQASLSGVKVIATAHAKNEQELKLRTPFIDLINNKIFERIVVLSRREGMGTVEDILNEDLDPII